MLKNSDKRLRMLESQRARAGGTLAVLVAISKGPKQVAADLPELEHRLPAG